MIERIEVTDNVLGFVHIDLLNPKTNNPYKVVAFVGENGCGKTTVLSHLFKTNQRALFIRQNSLFSSSQNEAIRLIIGKKDYYPSTNFQSNEIVTLTDEMHQLINNRFNDDELNHILEDNLLKDVKYGGEVTKLINGSCSSINIDDLSSGQKEILIKLSLIAKSKDTDIILLDEPETSLHPRWQREIVNTIYSLVTSENKNTQLFVATHSEKVLESLLKDEDTLIIVFKKEHKKFTINPIYDFKKYLSVTTLAELDYLVFGVVTMEYHDQLFNELINLLGIDNIGKIDNHIIDNPLYNDDYKKEWHSTSTKFNGKVKSNDYISLPVYIRNYFHHPKEGMKPNEEEVEKSIQFLIQLIEEYKC